ncbi:tRNA 2-thiouridine(34) synthase MnmA [Candidatus Marinamargulisbacteria bacterium SCGC AG-410-N11]|nr:tRNA 2-thiouridine(34) synthase MnmA [Candidatus Marinamargulisbacteria bacterium SCGC AG-410-N11]
MKRKKRVIVGMSGGVDSSVTAALLKKRGYDVIGITMQLLQKDSEKLSACCNLSSINDAKRVAHALKIPHYTINCRSNFQQKVIDYFINDYLLGYTPNPCVECNRYIKFDELYSKMKDLDADYVATGHYCKITSNPNKTRFFLKKAKDHSKDQSYFLYMMQSSQLKSILFPLGNYLKSEIRKMAQDLKFVNANKQDSQEICFVTKGSYRQFIEDNVSANQLRAGHITDINGKILGQHDGIHRFTIGQRRGIPIQSNVPYYVIKINAKTNTVIVGQKGDLHQSSVKLHTFTLVNHDESIIGKTFNIKSRYQMVPFKATVLDYQDNQVILKSHTPQQFVTPGQSGVLYQNDRVVGGGIIEFNEATN